MSTDLYVLEYDSQVIDADGMLSDTADMRPATPFEVSVAHPKCGSCDYKRTIETEGYMHIPIGRIRYTDICNHKEAKRREIDPNKSYCENHTQLIP